MKKRLVYFAAWLLFLSNSVTLRAQSAEYFTKTTPEAVGISSSAVLSFVEALEQEIDAVHSFMILRNGKQLAQGWWHPYDAQTPHTMHSLSKSFTSTAIGFAIDEGLLSLNDLVISFFPEEAPAEPGRQWKEMRIRDLLTMNTGHIDEPWPTPGETNWVKGFLASEVELKPGTHFKYNSMATYMLSAILQKVTGEKLVDYLQSSLFEPLQIKKPEWDTCPRGINTGGWGLHITTEDIAKLGQLYLQKGKWEGRQLLSDDWVEMATSRQVSNGSNPDDDWAQGYGFQFWRCRHNCYRGDGAMGQFCIVMPEQDAVVAITSGTNDMGGVMQLVWDILLPAMKEKPLLPDPQAHARLEEKTASLQLKPVEGEASSALERRVSQKKFLLEENPSGVESILFNFEGKKTTLTLNTAQDHQTIAIGSGVYLKGEMTGQLPYTANLSKRIAASGAWIKPDEYQVRIYLYESPARITYTFRFEEHGLVWNSKLEHALFAPRTQEQMIGRMVQ